jgi:hypothetical protein
VRATVFQRRPERIWTATRFPASPLVSEPVTGAFEPYRT